MLSHLGECCFSTTDTTADTGTQPLDREGRRAVYGGDAMARGPPRDCRQCSARNGHDSARHEAKCSTGCVTQSLPMGQGGGETLWIATSC